MIKRVLKKSKDGFVQNEAVFTFFNLSHKKGNESNYFP